MTDDRFSSGSSQTLIDSRQQRRDSSFLANLGLGFKACTWQRRPIPHCSQNRGMPLPPDTVAHHRQDAIGNSSLLL